MCEGLPRARIVSYGFCTFEQLCAAVVASADDAILIKSAEGEIVSWNEAAASLFGHAADDVVGTSLPVTASGCGETERDLLSMVLQGRAVRGLEVPHRMRNGRVIKVAVTLSPVRDQQGTVRLVSIIARAVT